MSTLVRISGRRVSSRAYRSISSTIADSPRNRGKRLPQRAAGGGLGQRPASPALVWDALVMDVRDSTNPVVRWASRWLAQFNGRHPWNHNEHFHGWILRNLPARRQTAVDVGCGAGVLAGKLAHHFARVTGIDADEGMATAAQARLAGDPR